MRRAIFRDVGNHPLKTDLLVPLHGVSVLFVEKQLAMHLQAFAVVLPNSRDEEVESEPVQDAEADQGPSHGWGREPWGGRSRAGGRAAGGVNPGGDDGEDIRDGEDGGGREADVAVHDGFFTPSPALGEAQKYEAQAEQDAKEGVDGVAV